MKLKTLALMTFLLIFVIEICDVEARGGRGGGGGGGSINRGSVGGGNINRGNAHRDNYSGAPTMSRSEVSRNRPSQLPSTGQRPSIGQESNRPGAGNRSGEGVNRPSGGNRPGQEFTPGQGGGGKQPHQAAGNFDKTNARDNTKQFLRDSKNRNIDKGTLDQKRQDFLGNRDQRDRQERRDGQNVREGIKDRWQNYDKWFDGDFYNKHNYYPSYWNDNVDWWRPAAWATLGAWLDWGWYEPIYYDDGYYPIQTTDYGYGYGTEQPQSYSSSTAYQTNATTAEVIGDWYPLGVFAVGKNADLAANSQMFVQLALDKNGEIGGTYYNATTDQTHEIVGSVDRETQLAAWRLADNPGSPLVSTGLYNLTKSSTEVVVDFPDGTEQIWTYVRLEK